MPRATCENVPPSLLFAGGLADNGGPTQTIALRDAATTRRSAAPIRPTPRRPTSAARRGRSRRAPIPDIGAFELNQYGPRANEIVGTDPATTPFSAAPQGT